MRPVGAALSAGGWGVAGGRSQGRNEAFEQENRSF